jgi:hypothetical protein
MNAKQLKTSILSNLTGPLDGFFGWLIVTGTIVPIIAAFYGCVMVIDTLFEWMVDHPLQALSTGAAFWVGWLVGRKRFGISPLLVLAEKHLKADFATGWIMLVLIGLVVTAVAGLAEGLAAVTVAIVVTECEERLKAWKRAQREAQREEDLEGGRESHSEPQE